MSRRHAAPGAIAVAVLASLVLGGCGGGGDSDGGSGSFCDDYRELANISGTDAESLQQAADLYRKLADEAPDAAKDDLNFLADAEEQVLEGNAASVDNSEARAAADRADKVATSTCNK